MSCCSKYNELLELPNSLRCIQDNFLGQCMVFNNGGDEDFVIPDSVQIIGQDFFSGCEDFNQNIEFTEYLNFLGYNCMFNCRSFTKNLEVNTAPSNINIGTG
ncbi:MAG: leucine-rich repeat domain-containing protein [Mycoplasmoidaceae bacterium]|nr:leucine-rich repeat domain-containing protein [Mycoplasmoidaceae bacterium]